MMMENPENVRIPERLREIAFSLRADEAWNEANWIDAAADEIERLRSMPRMHTDDMNDIVLMGLVLEEAKREIDRLRSLTTWQPIETAPKDGTWFLAWYPKENFTDDYGDFIEMTNWEPVPRELNADSWTIGGIDPSHWLPLPTPPES